MRLGVLDVGSNTVHLLVVDARPGGPPVPAASYQRELRLVEHLGRDGALAPAGRAALMAAVEGCADLAAETGCAEVIGFVTSALRDATDCDDVLAELRRRTGWGLQILSGEDEARRTFLAVRRWYGWSAGTLAVFDIGGGSLELAAGPEEAPAVAVSVPVGAGRMHRRFGDDLAAMRRHVRGAIGAVIGDVLRCGPFDKVVGTSKSFRTLARITGAAPRDAGQTVERRLGLAELSPWLPRIAAMDPTARTALPAVSPTRAPQLAAAAVVAEAVLDLAGTPALEICPWALREGLILDHLDRL